MVAVELWDSPSKYHTQESISANDFTILLWWKKSLLNT
jgi:hypothetical protein